MTSKTNGEEEIWEKLGGLTPEQLDKLGEWLDSRPQRRLEMEWELVIENLLNFARSLLVETTFPKSKYI